MGRGRGTEASSIPTSRTMAWLRPLLGEDRKRVLEVGCGGGEVARALLTEGHEVLAVDSDARSVARARERGVEARELVFPSEGDHLSGPFDIVFFGRVLHHIEDLGGACAVADSLLAEGGRVLVEDFAWERVDAATAEWAYGLLDLGRALGLVPESEWAWDVPPLEAWRVERKRHGIHTGASMIDALAGRFELAPAASAPYAYRWFARYLSDHPAGVAVTGTVLEMEERLASHGVIVPFGLRLVAQRASREHGGAAGPV